MTINADTYRHLLFVSFVKSGMSLVQVGYKSGTSLVQGQVGHSVGSSSTRPDGSDINQGRFMSKKSNKITGFIF